MSLDPTTKPAFGTVEVDPDHPLGATYESFWLLNENGGRTAHNCVRNAHHGYIVSTASNFGSDDAVGTKWSGNGLRFDNNATASDTYYDKRIRINHSQLLQPPAGSITVRVMDTFGLHDKVYVHKGDGATDAGSAIAMGRFSFVGNSNLFFWIDPGNGWVQVYADAAYSDANVWNTFTGSWSTRSVKISVNGREKGSTSGVVINTSCTSPLDFFWHPSGYTPHAFLDYACLHNTQLSPELVAWQHAEPYAGLREIQRRTYSVPNRVPRFIGGGLVRTAAPAGGVVLN